MSRNTIKNGIFVSIFMLLLVTPVSMLHAETVNHSRATSPLAEHIDTTQINPDYDRWVENNQEGFQPPAQNFSYLAESYSDNALTGNYTRSTFFPKKFDLRDFGKVDPVVNQANLGICWSIAANSSATGNLKDTHPQLSLSPFHTAWFSYNGKDEREFAPNANSYYSGGNDGRAVSTLAAWKGPVSTDKVPFRTNNLSPLDENLRYTSDFHLQDAYYMPNGVYYDVFHKVHVSCDITKDILMNVGPVTLNYHSHGKNSYNSDTYAIYNNTAATPDHAVLIVGWDDNYPKENFLKGNQPSRDGAWLIRNSWGTRWGDDGYGWISYEDRSLITGTAYLMEENTNYTTNYQYDLTGWSFSTYTDWNNPKQATAANIFTAKNNEQLEAVSFYTTDANARYNISVYTGVHDGSPQSGKCQLSNQQGQEPYAGYHTIELDQPVKLQKGERFSIVVTFSNPSYNMPLPIEWCPMKGSNFTPQYMGSGGESYVKKGGSWQDIAGDCGNGYYITNVCIKGFSNPLPQDGKAISTVQFSEMAGEISSDAMLSLEAEDGNTIYWSDGGNFKPYTEPISMNALQSKGKVTIRAYATDGKHKGRTVSKTFTFATAQLTDLAVKYYGTVRHFDTSKKTHTVNLPEGVNNVQIMAQSGDAITVNNQPLASADWSTMLATPSNQATLIHVKVQNPNKRTSTYTLTMKPPKVDGPQLYPVTLKDVPTNGTVQLSKDSAKPGEIITVTIKPDTGCVFSKITAQDETNNVIQLSQKGKNYFTFIMPDKPVYLSAIFDKLPEGALPFVDVPYNAWYYGSVQYVYEHDLMSGVNDTTFNPQAKVTRAMVWAVLARQSGYTDAGGKYWYSGAQQWAIENNVSDGSNPLGTVTREELITMLYRFKGAPAVTHDLTNFGDYSSISSWAKDSLMWGVHEGYISGIDKNTLAPQGSATRAQLATILTNFSKNAS